MKEKKGKKEKGKKRLAAASTDRTPPLPLTTTIPMSNPYDPLRFLARLFADSADTIQTACADADRTPKGIRQLIARRMTAPLTELGNCSVMEVFSLGPSPPSRAPPTAPSLPQ